MHRAMKTGAVCSKLLFEKNIVLILDEGNDVVLFLLSASRVTIQISLESVGVLLQIFRVLLRGLHLVNVAIVLIGVE